MNQVSKILIREWLDKADGDFEAALSLYKSRRKRKLLYIIAFHCQQAIEKYLKALMIGLRIDFPKTHDLVQLLSLIRRKDAFLSGIKNDLNMLNPFAVGFRYPGEDVTAEELKAVVIITKNLRNILLSRIKELL